MCCKLVSDKCCFITGRGNIIGSLTLGRGLWDGIQVVGVLLGCQYISSLFGDRCVTMFFNFQQQEAINNRFTDKGLLFYRLSQLVTGIYNCHQPTSQTFSVFHLMYCIVWTLRFYNFTHSQAVSRTAMESEYVLRRFIYLLALLLNHFTIFKLFSPLNNMD